MVLPGGPGMQQFCRGGGGALVPVLSGGNSGAGQEGDLCPCVTSAVRHSCGSGRCSWYISQMAAERVAVWSPLSGSGTCYSRAKHVSAGSQRSLGIFTILTVHNSFFVCKYPQLLAPTFVTSYLEMCFCSGARAQLSPWKAESLSDEKWQTRSDSVGYVKGKKAGSCSPCSPLQGPACSPWTGLGKPGQPWLFGNASCVLPPPASICCRLRWHPSHAGITWVITIS